MKISAVTTTYNEEHNIADLIKSLKDCDEIIIADDKSTDDTVQLARSLGAKTFIRADHRITPKKSDIRAFRRKYGWLPKFTEESKIHNGSACRMEGISYAKNDWVLNVDADERVSWDFDKIQKLLSMADQISCHIVQTRKPDGSPEIISPITKLFKKDIAEFTGFVHEVVMPKGKNIYSTDMRIDHYSKRNRRPSYSVMQCLEYDLIKFNKTRTKFYLGREYFAFNLFDRAIIMLEDYLKTFSFREEVGEAYHVLARCYLALLQPEKAKDACMKAIMVNPSHKAPFYLMADLHSDDRKDKWKYIGDKVKNDDVLY